MQIDHSALQRIRRERPLLHCISNLVTATDCANAALALGARPVMAQEPQEMAEIAAAARACILNTGTPDDSKFLACTNAGKAANAAGVPVVLDPVGAGATQYRRKNIGLLLQQVSPDLIRANLSEVQAITDLGGCEAGVDSLSPHSEKSAAEAAQKLALLQHCTVLLSGAEDIVTDGKRTFLIRGGSPLMSRITGAGCMLSVIAGAFLCCSDDPVMAAAGASALWKRCGELADAKGCGSFHAGLFDALTNIDTDDFADHISAL